MWRSRRAAFRCRSTGRMLSVRRLIARHTLRGLEPLGGFEVSVARRVRTGFASATFAALILPMQAHAVDSVRFAYSGHAETGIGPEGVGRIGVDAAGGAGAGEYGGLGGWTHAVLPVTPGQTLVITVGGAGHGTAAGFNGGGDGGWNN